MNVALARLRALLWWLLPSIGLAVLLGWEIDWGGAMRMHPPPPEPIASKPVAAGLLPDYVIAGGAAAHAETVDRTLFNPTRRPAPVLADTAKLQIQRGQFTLTGTTVAGERGLAFLKETNGGKPRTVKQGETINGMLVAEVKPDRVKLTLGDESEEIVLKVATNPKPTPQPAPAPAQPGQQPPGTPSPISPAVRPQPPVAGGQEPQQTLAERRRAARAAAAAAAAAASPAGAPAPQAIVPAPQQAPVQPAAAPSSGAENPTPEQGWAQVYQRYQQRRQQQ